MSDETKCTVCGKDLLSTAPKDAWVSEDLYCHGPEEHENDVPKRPGLKVLEFPGPTAQVDNGWAQETLENVAEGIRIRAEEHNDPVAGIAVCVAYESGTVGHNWAGSHRTLLVGGLHYLQKLVIEEDG